MVKQQVIQVVTDERTGIATAGGTIATAFATILEVIPSGIGKLGVLVGIILSLTLIVVNIRTEMRKTKLDNLEIDRRRKKLENL